MPLKICILVGFQYKTGDDHHIPGTIVDLYIAHRYFSAQGWDVRIITDIKSGELPRGVSERIIRGDFGDDILEFLADAKDELSDGYGRKYASTPSQFMLELERVMETSCSQKRQGSRTFSRPTSALGTELFGVTLKDDVCQVEAEERSKIVFYYTGHGERGHMITPSKGLVSFVSLKNLLIRYLDGGKLTVILDCCYPCHLDLPYVLKVENGRESFRERSSPPARQPLVAAKTVRGGTRENQQSVVSKAVKGVTVRSKNFGGKEGESSIYKVPHLIAKGISRLEPDVLAGGDEELSLLVPREKKGISIFVSVREPRPMTLGTPFCGMFLRDNRIICITSSMVDERSIAEIYGSRFTACLFRLLGKGKPRLSEIMSICSIKGQYRQSVQIHSSHSSLADAL